MVESAATGDDQGEPSDQVGSPNWPKLEGETSWDRIARLRLWREQLDQVIAKDTPAAVRAARAAGVKVPQLAKLWQVSEPWIYTVAPARAKKNG
ncbi:MAG: hypothetical protein HOV94_43990 [Saccharothrix sp.]|nr:hypothetical protein [Saccharothrix sp.]